MKQPNPRHRATLLLLGAVTILACSVSRAEKPIYRTVEKDGTVVFTDQPVADSEIVEGGSISVVGVDAIAPPVDIAPLPPEDGDMEALEQEVGDASAGTNAATAVATAVAPAPAAQPPSAPPLLTSFAIASPPADATLIDVGSPAKVQLETAPLSIEEANLRAELWLDGERVAASDNSIVEFAMPHRGTHELEARVVDSAGNVLATTPPQAIHVRQPTSR